MGPPWAEPKQGVRDSNPAPCNDDTIGKVGSPGFMWPRGATPRSSSKGSGIKEG